MIITFANPKGGVGKSTLATIVAESLIKGDKQNIELIDLDPRMDFSFFIQQWAKNSLSQQKASATRVKTNLRHGLDVDEDSFVVIDTPPGKHSKATLSAISNADVIVIPFEVVPVFYNGRMHEEGYRKFKQYVSSLQVKPYTEIIFTLNRVSSYDSDSGQDNESIALDMIENCAEDMRKKDMRTEIIALAESYKLRTNVFSGKSWDYLMRDVTYRRYDNWVETVIQTDTTLYGLDWKEAWKKTFCGYTNSRPSSKKYQ